MSSLYKEDPSYLSGRGSWGNSQSLYAVGYVGVDFSRQCCLYFAQGRKFSGNLDSTVALIC